MMFDAQTIKKLLTALNAELARTGHMGEVGLCGGAVMCLVFQSREATKDIDGIFEPTTVIRKAIKRVAQRMGVDESWLNDAAKGFFSADPPKQEVLNLSNLRVWAPKADYMLAMKCISARIDTHDRDDVLFLIRHLGIKRIKAVYKVIERYYPKKLVPAKTQFLLEEIMA